MTDANWRCKIEEERKNKLVRNSVNILRQITTTVKVLSIEHNPKIGVNKGVWEQACEQNVEYMQNTRDDCGNKQYKAQWLWECSQWCQKQWGKWKCNHGWGRTSVNACKPSVKQERQLKLPREKCMSHREQGGNWCVRREYPNTASTAHEMCREILEWKPKSLNAKAARFQQ